MTETPDRTLGETDEELLIERSEALREVSLSLATQARHSLDIVTRHLDPAIYDSEAFVTAVKSLILNSRRARVRIMVLDSGPLLHHGHRLVDVAQRLSSYVALRVPGPEHKDFNEAWLVADNTGYAHRRYSDRFEAIANFNDRRQAGALTSRLDELWNHALADPNFRRLHL